MNNKVREAEKAWMRRQQDKCNWSGSYFMTGKDTVGNGIFDTPWKRPAFQGGVTQVAADHEFYKTYYKDVTAGVSEVNQ